MSKSVKGLMIKDIKLIKSQMRFFFAALIVMGIFLAGSFNVTFLVGYTAVLCSFLLLTTFSFDEFENGSAFLFTLPISRKDYVAEKYLFGILLATVPFALMSVLSWAAMAVRHPEMSLIQYLISISAGPPMAYLLLALEIPIQIKFGQTKSRVVTILMIGGMSACLGMVNALNEAAGVDPTEFIDAIAGLGGGILVLLTVVVIILLLLLSYKISCRIMEKKEF